ncbi:major Facilitator Superfamily protein [Janthinobacterium agaricidamnosum NBRC 102515 = DSM 9628]|uniref:Major Facilitator Superfamily protein n=1 Tax=Janthinobacterium agaricidamnosum NBRC 102515 = DSM 9628 TaxID=1349767 RepID=W0V2T0_9BURK|nr:major Facilitator Superfamily protein [Janthinobacterium agaricidamnosum NBRC 102515 = DSM 9628]
MLLILAIVAGVSIANIYYNQPLLDNIRLSFPHQDKWIGAVPGAGQIGFAIGMLMLAPLGDRLDRRRLILVQIVGLCLALIATAMASSLFMLIGAVFAIGVFASMAQQAGPFAAELAPATQRGHAIGTVMGGLLLGILLARTASGFVAEHFGWRAVFLAAVFPMITLAALVARYLPASHPTSTLTYPKLLASLWQLFLEFRLLREAALTGAALFAAFSLFWSILSLLLAHPPFNLGPAASGLFGIVAAAGAVTAPWAGKCSDRWGSRRAISLAIGLVALSFVIFSFSGASLAGLVIGVIVLDVGLQVAQTPNQSRIFALAPAARSRLNTVYMICYFCGGALGSAVGIFAWQTFGWPGACAAGIFFSAVAAGSHFRGNGISG